MNYARLLDGKTAVVTCGDCAVGAAIVRLFAGHGAIVAFGAKDEGAASILIGSLGGISPDSFYWPCDLADSESVEAFCAEINRRRPLVDVLINNPWMDYSKAFEDSDDDDDALLLQVYQRSIVQTLRAFWPAMLKAGRCSVVNISSDSVFKAVQGSLMFTTANGAIGGMTRVPAVEGGYREVRVNEILAGFYVNRDESVCEQDISGSGDGGRGDGAAIDSIAPGGEDLPDTAAGVAKAALFLASDMASYVSGVSIAVG